MPRTLKTPASAPLLARPEKPGRKLYLEYAGPFMGSDHGCALKVGRCIPLVSDMPPTTTNCLRNSFSIHGVPEMTCLNMQRVLSVNNQRVDGMKLNHISHQYSTATMFEDSSRLLFLHHPLPFKMNLRKLFLCQ